jgi:hypothetical protein
MFQTKQFNTRNALKAKLLEANGTPVDLTGATVRFYMQSSNGVVVNRAMQVGENGEVLFVFESDEVAQAGLFNAEIIVTYGDNRKEIYPNDGYIRVYIEESIGGDMNAV